ncbi:MAG: DUF5915 domain-containing protein [Polyangiaceae bacterium]
MVLDPADRAALGAVPTKTVDVKPVEVPRLPEKERVYVDDVATPAPGADAFRWFFYASNPPWNATRHSLSNVRTLQKDFLVKLRNVYSFFTIYANIDGFDPYANDTLVSSSNAKSELDAWLESELATTTAGVVADLDGYDLYAATQKLGAFCESLSNWYVRRSRERFWRGGRLEADADKRAAYATLHGALVTFAKLVAPFVPFASEAMYRNLVVGPAKRAGVVVPESVHLARYPVPNRAHEDVRLSRKMEAVRELVSLGLQVRTQHKLKVRQPLRAAHVILTNAALADDLAKAERMIRDELNVLEVKFVATANARSFVDYRVKPNFRTLGQRGLGKEAQMLKKAMADASADEAARIHGELLAHGKATAFGVDLLPEDVEIAFDTKEGFAAAGGRIGVVVIETALDEELRSLGLVREVQNRIQTERKELGLEYTDRITLTIVASERVIGILKKHQTDLAREVLATTVAMENADTVSGDPTARGLRPLEVEGEALHVGVARSNP